MFLAAIGKRRRLKGAAWAGLFPSILQFQAAECEIIFNGMLSSETVNALLSVADEIGKPAVGAKLPLHPFLLAPCLEYRIPMKRRLSVGPSLVEVVEGNGSRVPDIPASGEGANRER